MQNQDQHSIFREANLKKATDPDQLNRFLRVTGFGPWFVVAAAALLLAAIFVWAFFGKIQTVIAGAGYCEDGVITCYFSEDVIGDIPLGARVDINGNEGTVIEKGASLFQADDIVSDVLYLLPESKSSWYSTDKIQCELDDGLYPVKYYGKEIHPVSFLTQRQ